MNRSNIGERIKKARLKKGMTQKELAEQLGISYVMISQYERGERNPKIDMIKRIASILDTDYVELILNEDNPILETEFIKKITVDIKKNTDELTEKINIILKSFKNNDIDYEITESTPNFGHPLSFKITHNEHTMNLDVDDIVYIYDISITNFNNTVKYIIDILENYKQGD